MKNKLSLKQLMRVLSVAASFANEQLSRDFTKTLEKMEKQKLPLPPLHPLLVSNMKVSFSAFVTEADQAGFAESGDDLQLDFNKPGNFRGEIVFSQYEPEMGSRPDFADTTTVPVEPVVPDSLQSFESINQELNV